MQSFSRNQSPYSISNLLVYSISNLLNYNREIQPQMQILSSQKIEKKGDFVSSIKYEGQTNSLAAIHQLPFVKITPDVSINYSLVLPFQSNVYDALFLHKSLVVSNKHMPLRIYSLENPNAVEVRATFYDRKKNSELFLTPIQMAAYCGKVVGGGKKFLSQYDLTKIAAKQLKQMGQKYISSVDFLQPNLVLAGSFTGDIQFLDLSSGQIVQSIRPHMDLVTRLKRVPLSDTLFVSLARKDNLCYSWDARNMSSFVGCFEHPLYGNQRTGMEITHDGSHLLLGGEHGEIYTHNLKEGTRNLKEGGQKEAKFQLGVQKCVSSICCGKDRIYCSVGQRGFALAGEPSDQNYIYELSGLDI